MFSPNIFILKTEGYLFPQMIHNSTHLNSNLLGTLKFTFKNSIHVPFSRISVYCK